MPSSSGGLPRTRRFTAFGVAAVTLLLMTVVMVRFREDLDLESVLLLYVLAVVIVSVLGGVLPAIGAALGALLLATHYFTEPYGTWDITHRLDIIALVTFLLVAVGVSVTVELAARARVAAARERIEADLLSRVSAASVGESSLVDVLTQVRDNFGMTSVALLADGPGGADEGGAPRAVGLVGPPLAGRPVISADAGDGMRLVAEGPQLFAADQRLLQRLAGAAARAWEAQRLAEEAARARQLAEVDRLRSALLAAVGHDLRTPLAGVKAAVSSLRQPDVAWTEAERAEFLAQIESSADRLGDLMANLLAMSRLQAGVLSVELDAVALDAVVARALLDLDCTQVDVDVPDDLPHAHTDDGLLERVVANLVDNARRFSPPGVPVRVAGAVTPDRRSLRLSVVDRGPGVPPAQWESMFIPFQRLDDRGGSGVGLGLAIARGFTEAVGGSLQPSATEGGGLTMTVTLPVAAPVRT